MAGEIYTIRQALKTAIQSVSGGGYSASASRTILGYDVVAPNPHFWSNLSADGPYIVIRPASQSDWELSTVRTSICTVPIDVYVGFARNTDNTFVNIETFIRALDLALLGADVLDVRWELEIQTNKNPAIAHYSLEVQVRAS